MSGLPLLNRKITNLQLWSQCIKGLTLGRAIAEAVSRWLPTAVARVHSRAWQVGFVVDKMALGQVFSEYFGFPCQPHFIPSTSASSQSLGTGTIGQYMAAVPRGPSMDSTSHNSNKKKGFNIF
jgi:hypothetical protein